MKGRANGKSATASQFRIRASDFDQFITPNTQPLTPNTQPQALPCQSRLLFAAGMPDEGLMSIP